jgi:hypothetical protein
MSSAPSALETLAVEYLPIRAKILEVAAALDRIDRAEGAVAADPRLANLRAGLATLSEAEPGRAERVQLIFSRPYDAGWRRTLGVSAPGKAADDRIKIS